MENITKGQSIELRVQAKKKVNARQCYIVETPDGRKQALNLLRFQFEDETPETLRCIVKDINPISGELTLEQDFSPYLRRFYEKGQEYSFTVIREGIASKKKKTFVLSDSYGFLFIVNEKRDTKLFAHQQVKCLVEDIKGNKLSLKLTDSARKESDKSKNLQQRITEAIESLPNEHCWDRRTFVELIFSVLEKKSIEEQCTVWLQNELMASEDDRQATLEEIRTSCLYLLEGTDILKNEQQAERSGLQERISKLLDLTERFIEAVEIVKKDECESYIDALLEKLSCSGYIYHPNHRLGILITIFALRTELMESRMNDLLDVIHQGTLDYWRQEPFRSAFIKLLEMYIKACRRHADLVSVNASSGVRLIIKALSVQLLLANTLDEKELNKLPCDLRLNKAMLYRYASYLMTRSPKTLLERSFRSLMETSDTVIYYNWEDTKNVEVLANKLSAYVEAEVNEEVDDLQQHVFKGQKAQLRIGNSGVLLYPSVKGNLFGVLPEELNLWHKMQVMLPETLSRKTRVNMDTLRPYKQMWLEIEQSIFGEKKTKQKTIRKVRPDQGDKVHIRIDKVMGDTLHCIIEDNVFAGEGTMSVTDIVDWNPRLYDDCFLDENGNPLLMEAKVVSVTPEGKCTFNMKRLIREWAHNEFAYGEKSIARIKSVVGNTANGVTSDGLPITAVIPADMDSIVCVGDYIEVIKNVDDDMRHSNITVGALRHTTGRWDETMAFMTLMNYYADDVLEEESDESDREVILEDAEMDPLYVKELILLLDRQAAVEPTIRSFNYLGMARLIGLLMNDKEISEYYRWRMALLEMLQDFSLNERVDESQLEELKKTAPDIFAPGSQLRLRFMQIIAISCQGHPERNHELWNIVTEESDENLKELASMVLSWNFTSGKEMGKVQEEINARIFHLLSLKQRRSTKKSYGREGKTIEFKTSLVFPPENHYRPDLKTQTHAIMKEVAAFLNTDGGTLYLGVNNEGVATGLENDLAYRPFCYSPDKYDVYFHNQVKAQLGLEANSLVSCDWEETDDRQVYVISVKPCPHVVLLGGTIYERHDSSSEPLTGAYREEFMKKRPLLVAQLADSKKEEPQKGQKEEGFKLSEISDKITTSAWRNNVLFNWESDFVEPEAYLCFQPDYKFCILAPEQPPYDTEEYDLALSLKEEDKNGYLILAYQNGRVCKVAVKELLEKKYLTCYKRAAETLLFACPAQENDYLLTVLRDDNGYLLYRTDKVETLQREKITNTGELLSPYVHYEIISADIVPARLSQYCRETPGKSGGISAMTGFGPVMRDDLMRELGIEIMKL